MDHVTRGRTSLQLVVAIYGADVGAFYGIATSCYLLIVSRFRLSAVMFHERLDHTEHSALYGSMILERDGTVTVGLYHVVRCAYCKDLEHWQRYKLCPIHTQFSEAFSMRLCQINS